MKKNGLKRIVSLALTMSITVVLFMPNVGMVNAADTNSNSSIITVQVPQAVATFAITEFPKQIKTAVKSFKEYGLDDSDVTKYTLGAAFNVYNFVNESIDNTDIYYYPVLYKAKVKATLAITKSPNGSLSSTFSKGFADSLENTIETNTNKSFRIVKVDGDLRAISDNNSVLIAKDINKGTASEITLETIKKINKLANKNINSIKYKETSNKITTSITTTQSPMIVQNIIADGPISSKYLAVPIVLQYNHPNCWSATCASIINFKNNNNALSSMIVATYIFGSNCFRGASDAQSIQAYNHWGYRPYLCNYNETWTDAKSVLNSNNPIDSSWYPISGSTGHAMTVRGYEQYSDGSRSYLLIDPNSGYTSVTAQTYSGDCVYSINGQNYYWTKFIKGF